MSHSLVICKNISSLIVSILKITLSKILGHQTNEQIQRCNVLVLAVFFF